MMDNIISKYKAFFKQEKWLSTLLIGGVLCYIPIFGWIILWGYILQVLENAKQGKDSSFPEWNNFEKLFFDGLPPFVLVFIYSIASFIITKIVAVVLCLIGVPISFLLSLLLGLVLPLVVVVFSYRLLDLKNWQLALNFAAMKDDIQKSIKGMIPALIAFTVLIFISIMIGCGLLSGFPVFVTAVVYYSILGEKFLKIKSSETTVTEENSEETKVAEDKPEETSNEKKEEDSKEEPESLDTKTKESDENKKD